MMAHKLPKGFKSLFMTGGSSLRARPFAPTITDPQARRTLDQTERACKCQSSWWSPSHTHRPGSDHFVNVVRYPRENIDLVPATSGPISSQWQRGRGFLHAITPFSNTASLTSKTGQWEGGQGFLHAITPFSNTASLTSKTGQWEGVQVLEEDSLPQKYVPRTADTSLMNHGRQNGQKSVQFPPVVPSSPTTLSPFKNRPHRRRRYADTMPRCGYDTTNMRMAANPRPAASARGSGQPRHDKSKNDGNSDGDNGSGSGREHDDRYDDDKGSKKTAEKETGRGSKHEGMTTEELIKTIDDVRLPLEGRGWTFWL